jgi:PAS domain S-box-containing protein
MGNQKNSDSVRTEDLFLEIEELRTRLAQAEETINSIRNGEVDAIIVSGSDGEKVFSLTSSETPYRIIIEEMGEGALTISSSGTILYCNRRFSEIICTHSGEIAGSDFSDLIDEKDRGKFRQLLNDSLKTKVRGVVSCQLDNGKRSHLQLSFVPLPPHMEGDVCIIVSDITEITNYQKYLQEMVEERSSKLRDANRQLSEDVEMLRRAGEQLRDLNASKDKFFSIITHDLKSPFTSIIGFSELLSEKINKGDFADIKEYASIIHNSSWRVMDLLTNLIEWSRYQTGRMEFDPEEINFSEIVEETIELLKVSSMRKSITVDREIPADLLVTADKAMIGTVLRNLISNAIKFTRQGGKIKISAHKNENELSVSVNDNGIGMKKEIIENLFNIGESTTSKGTAGEHGTGLGLLICKDFVTLHGGEIWAESAPEKGSTFFFTLPLNNIAGRKVNQS